MRIAVLIPCYNEEGAIAQVVRDFHQALPQALVYVYDNNSKDGTVEVAKQAGAVVRAERLQGKGNVVRRMFADVDADVYVLVDGDATYHAASATTMIDRLVAENLDMVVGTPPEDRSRGRIPLGPSMGQPNADRSGGMAVRRSVQGHAVGLSGVFAPLRQNLSRLGFGLRNRNRAFRSCRFAAYAGSRNRNAVFRPS